MTLEQWILNNALEIAAMVFLGVFAVVKLKAQSERAYRTQEAFEQHIDADSPHKACPVHSSQISDVVSRLDDVCAELRELRKVLIDVLKEAVKGNQ